MALTIKLGEIGDYAEEKFERLLRKVVLETDKRLKEASPVDSGRLRASWQIGENIASGGFKPEGKYAYTILPAERINYQTERVGNVYSIHNNLPYVEPVLMGKNMPRSWQGRWRSKDNQIEKGYPRVIAKDMRDYVQKVAQKIARES